MQIGRKSEEIYKFCRKKGKFINFAEIGGIYKFCRNRGNKQYALLAWEVDAPVYRSHILIQVGHMFQQVCLPRSLTFNSLEGELLEIRH